MFGGAKPTFGTGTGTTAFGAAPFTNTANPSPFGQSTFGKPAASFGAAPAFGAQQAAPSLFGSTAGQAQPTGLFGNTSSAFGATTNTPSFGAFSQPQQNTSIFGAAQPAANTSSLFSQPAASAFGAAVKPAGLGGFGQPTAQPSTSLFGQTTASTSTGNFGSFGQAAPTTTNVFGSGGTSAFGQPAAAAGANAGSSIAKYQPTIGTDTLMKGGQPNNVNTKQHCITAMKEYESKSLEEIRMEDYLANRKGNTGATGSFFGSQPAATGTGLFGTTTNQPTTGLFGQTGATQPAENKSLFGTGTFGQPAASSAFGAPAQQQNSFMGKPFGTPSNTSFGAAGGDASANPFGAKPAFGQAAPTLFGQAPAASAAPAFGQTTSGFGGFGTTAGATQQPSMFGAPAADPNKTAFGMGNASTANTGFGGFGTTTTSTASGGGGLFGAKPATGGFGAAPAFGATSTATTGFGNFSMNNTAAGTAPGGLFNTSLNKPSNTSFGGFGTQTSTAPLNFNTGTAAGGSFFGNAASKPGGLFGNTLGGQNTTAGGGSLFGGGATNFNTGSSLGGGFGTSTLGGNTTLGGGLGGAFGQQQQQQQQQAPVPIHQQILSKVTSPYGDNPIFRDLKRNDETDATRATNPAAQKSIIESTTSQFKLSSKPSPVTIRVKPVGTAISKKSLFEGLEVFDSSVESFSLKPNAKRLILKPTASDTVIGSGSKSLTTPSSMSASNLQTSSPYISPQRQSANASRDNLPVNARNESFSGEIPTTNPSGGNAANAAGANDYSRRESWLHPNNLEKVRQHNLNVGLEGGAASPLNNSLSDLVPRKPIETYRSSIGTPTQGVMARASMSAVAENPFEDQASTSSAGRAADISPTVNDSLFSNRSYGGEDRSVVLDNDSPHQIDYEEHPTGITLRRVGYYTIPSMDDLKSYLAEDGSCVVPNFTVGREGYGNVYFGKEMDVANLNIDEIVHFRNKEIIIYPDDDNKPPIGTGLNREAQVTLDQVWPHDKTKHEPIKDPQRLAEMDWEGRLRRVCDKNDTRFIEYRPETGSWVFRVKHFSKYGLNDSDEEEDTVPTDPKKAKMLQGTAPGSLGNKPPAASKSADPKMIALKNATALAAASADSHYPMDESAEFMLMDKTQYLQNAIANNSQDYSNTFQSPTAALAKEQGMDAYKLQLMKASFFANDECNDDDEVSLHSEFPDRTFSGTYRTHKHHQSVDYYGASSQTFRRESAVPSEASSHMDFSGLLSPAGPPSSSSVSVMSIIRETQTDTSSTQIGGSESTTATLVGISNVQMKKKLPPFAIRPRVAQIKTNMISQLPFAKSFAHAGRFEWPADLGLYNSRRFKFSFGPQNTVIVPTTKNNLMRDIKNENLLDVVPEIFKPRAANDFSVTVLQCVKISSTLHYENFHQSVVDHLKIQLRHSIVDEVEGSECPWMKSDNATQLIVQHLDEAIKQMNLGPLEEYAVSVWSLCLALWGEHEELDGRKPSSHVAVMSRRNLLSEWLENTLTDKDLLTKVVSKHTYLDYMLELVMSHKVMEACELAFRYDDGNLALLLSQLSSGAAVRQLMEDQLAAWHKDKADTYIELERLKLFMLVAGVSLMNSAHGPVNTLEDMEWIKVLAIQLWYLSSPTASITDALLSYEKSFKSEEFYSMPPSPHYLDSESVVKQQKTLYDLRYHLLQLYSTRSQPMESLLNPATHTSDPMDYRLSWLLLQTLEGLGYRHCGALCESQIHVGFAAQLENNDMWEWAIFVLLHIKNRNQREIAVQNILYRYVSVSKDVALSDKEKFVINNLGVPEKWIDYAKAVKAGSTGNRHMQAKYLLKAKQWSMAHEVIFQYIAPDAVINDNLDYLHELLSQFEGAEMQKFIKVPNWSNQGQIFLDFIDINEKFKGLKLLKTEADIEAQWENLKPQLADLCSRINLLPCPTPKHRLCQSEIAQNLSCLVRGVLLVCPVLNPCLIIKIALERLPLPQEFAQQELRALLDTLVGDLAKVNSTGGSNEFVAVK